MDEEVVTELIQEQFNSKNLKTELTKLLDTNRKEILQNKYAELEAKLGGIGASVKTAKLIIKDLE